MNRFKYLTSHPIAIVFSMLTLLAAACACQPGLPAAKKINLGRQQGAITLATGSNNDLNIAPSGGTTTIIRLVPNSAGSILSGMNSTQVSDGDLFLIRNEGTTGNITITNADTASVDVYRFLTPSASSIILPPKAGVWVEWDATAVRWLATPGANGGDQITVGTGHVRGTGTAPALTSCGTAPAVLGSDVAGVVTTGSAATTCTITFARTYTTVPSCYFLPTGTATMPVYTVSATAITVTTDIASTVYNYGCVGQ